MAVTTPLVVPQGTPAEQGRFEVLNSHYYRSKADLDIRRPEFDVKDRIYRSFVDESNWPYRALVSDPSTFTFLTEKTSRLISNKLRGRVIPRRATTWLQAKISNELLDWAWDEADEGGSMIEKWSTVDQNTRKYGSGFALLKWRFVMDSSGEVIHDHPEMRPWANRDVLYNPDHPNIKDWIQLRDYVTLEELQAVNDLARSKPVYKNLDILEQVLADPAIAGAAQVGISDRRDTNYVTPNKAMQGLTDTLGSDPYTHYLEVITEYKADTIKIFCPKHGVVIRETKNPWREIPVLHLRYYKVDDDFYGLSEIEPIEKLQKVENAILSQYLDTINSDLYPPLIVRSTGVRMDTLEFGPNKKWIVDDMENIRRFETSAATTSQFVSTISFIISRMSNAMGETSQAVSNIDPFSPHKTATEIQDQSMQRLARDNFNQIFLAEALKKQMLLWLKMFSKMLDSNLLIQVTGKEALAALSDTMLRSSTDEAGNPVMSAYGPNQLGLNAPIHPVVTGKGENKVVAPKFELSPNGDAGSLIIEPKDLDGLFDYIPDVESMSLQQKDQGNLKMEMLQMITTNPIVLQLLQAEGMKPKIHDLLVESLEDAGFKDASRFFEAGQLDPSIGGLNGPQAPGNQINAPGGGVAPAGNVPAGVAPAPGVGQGPSPSLGA